MNAITVDASRDAPVLSGARRWAPVVLAVTRSSPIDPALVLAVMHTESWFDPVARSRAGACGLMQLIPDTGARTALEYLTGRRCPISKAALFRPRLNILLGVAYLEWLWMREYSWILPNDRRTVVCLAAYNAGPSRVNRWLNECAIIREAAPVVHQPATEPPVNTLTIGVPWRETRFFVESVARRRPRYRSWLARFQSAPTEPGSGALAHRGRQSWTEA